MSFRRHLFALALLAVPHSGLADDGRVWVAGPQPQSCGTFLQESYSEGWRMWILGFWSGMNWEAASRSKGVTGSSTDSNGIVASVRKRCQDDPALSVPTVIARMHEEFEKDGR